MSIGQKIKELRMKKNLSVPNFAQALGVERTTVYTWEGDRVRPKANMLEEIAKLLEVEVKEFTELKKENEKPTDSNAWWQEKEKWYQAQIDRLTRLLELATEGNLGKCEGCPLAPGEALIVPLIQENKDAPGEAVEIKPLKKAA